MQNLIRTFVLVVAPVVVVVGAPSEQSAQISPPPAISDTVPVTGIQPELTPESLTPDAPIESRRAPRVQPGEILFNEIELSPQGVIAYDTLGNRWTYDFQTDEFVAGDLPGRDTRPTDIALPVEQRSTEQLLVKPVASYVNVGYEQFVDGDINATGRVVVQGWVKGNIRSWQRVLVTPHGRVDGSIYAPQIDVEAGGIVLGTISETSNPMSVLHDISTQYMWVVLGILGFWLIFTFVLVSLAPHQFRNIQSCVSSYQLRSFLLGLLLLLLMGPAMAVFAVTIIGLVVTIAIPFAYLLAMSLGVITFGNRLINRLMLRLFGRKQSLMFQSLVGVSLFAGVWLLVVNLLASNDPTTNNVGMILLVVVTVGSLYPVCTGLGAAFLTRFGFRPYISYRDRQAEKPSAPPVPPPIPKAPPVVGPPPTPPPSHRPGSAPLSPGND
jgi:hypothetical protein